MDWKSVLKLVVPLVVGLAAGLGIDLGVSPTGDCPECPVCEQVAE